MRLLTRSFDTLPPEVLDYQIYAISTTKPQRHRELSILWLFAPTFEAQIEYNRTKDVSKFLEKMEAVIRQRGSAIESWVKSNADARICLACWEGIDSCHRRLASEAIKQAGDRNGIDVSLDLG